MAEEGAVSGTTPEVADSHCQIARYFVCGMCVEDIAYALGRHPDSIREILRRSETREQIDRLRAMEARVLIDTRADLDDLVQIALATARNLLEDERTSPNVRARLIGEILDRHPTRALPRQTISRIQEQKTEVVSNETIHRVVERAEALGMEPEMRIPAEIIQQAHETGKRIVDDAAAKHFGRKEATDGG